MRFIVPVLLVAGVLFATSCKKNVTAEDRATITFVFKFDSTQARLNNIGQPTGMAVGNAAQSPVFNSISAHYIELAPSAFTALGSGTVLYRAPETTAGGANAIDVEQSTIVGAHQGFFSMPIKDLPPGEYEFLRLSLAYQNFDVKYYLDTVIAGTAIRQEFFGTVAGFIGFNNYIKSFPVKERTITVNGNRPQGFWGFESSVRYGGLTFPVLDSATAPAGATTVVNPIFTSSPVPAGSCVVTAAFSPGKLVIRGDETQNMTVEVSLSTNKSFEWREVVHNGLWEPTKGEKVQDMGIRGMLPRIL
ncbi:hypothetical protein EPD60_09120 [Flaviaesturariibacter flavus]|uniref:Uncharacterized protein n=1 Tax=Flaviaesturariibacter flavus TaxID=2502780 RepID=A0A4R1BB33_9BACT|nr:hypothetical protein [Flaviaesturariibacter flavus]TCJ14157.1 hypothetical protein EPD60_09120 [Flaviaesturariibacter flavus]